jgi:hypothetical protein
VNEPDGIRKLKPGRRTAILRFQACRLYYSFTLLPAQSRSRTPFRIFNRVCAAGITLFPARLKSMEIRYPIINAFLTLSAVTKW